MDTDKEKIELMERVNMFLGKELCKMSFGKLTIEFTFMNGKCTTITTDARHSVQMKN